MKERIKYELAVRLRDAGFPQIGGPEGFINGEDGVAYAPTNKEIKMELWKMGDDRKPISSQTEDEVTKTVSFMMHLGRGATFDEAVVNLYILLKK